MEYTALIKIENEFNVAEKEYVKAREVYETIRRDLRNAERAYLETFEEEETKECEK